MICARKDYVSNCSLNNNIILISHQISNWIVLLNSINTINVLLKLFFRLWVVSDWLLSVIYIGFVASPLWTAFGQALDNACLKTFFLWTSFLKFIEVKWNTGFNPFKESETTDDTISSLFLRSKANLKSWNAFMSESPALFHRKTRLYPYPFLQIHQNRKIEKYNNIKFTKPKLNCAKWSNVQIWRWKRSLVWSSYSYSVQRCADVCP